MLKNIAFQALKTPFSIEWIMVDGFRYGYYVLTQYLVNFFLNPFIKSYKRFLIFFVKFAFEKTYMIDKL